MVQPGNTPSISIATSSITFAPIVSGNSSASQNTTTTAANLTNPGSITSPGTWLELSFNNSTPWSSSLSLPITSGNWTGAPVVFYFRVTSVAPVGPNTGNITVASSGASPKTIAVTATVTSPGASLNASPLSFTGMSAVAGTQGSSVNYLLTGSNLGANNVTVTAPTNFLVSKDNSSFATSQVVTPSSGSVNQTIYTAIASTALAGAVSGNISNVVSGASTVNVSVSGVVSSPSSADSINVNFWNSANGNVNPANGWNNIALIESGSPQTSATLLRTTGVSSGVTVTISTVDLLFDNFDNGAGYGNATTLPIPPVVWRIEAVSTASEAVTLTLNGLVVGHHYNFLIGSGANTGTARPQSFAIPGQTTQNLDARQNINTLVSFTSITAGATSLVLTVTPTSGASTSLNFFQLVDNH